jgi:hypothetical protein
MQARSYARRPRPEARRNLENGRPVRTIDVHALRTTFGTLLSKGGVAPRTAQAAMRHSDIDLTMNVYTDPRLLDVQGALDVLPALPLNSGQSNTRESLRATGTDTYRRCAVALPVALNDDIPVTTPTIADKMGTVGMASGSIDSIAAGAENTNKKGTFTIPVNVPERAGEEIRTPDVQLGKLAFYH